MQKTQEKTTLHLQDQTTTTILRNKILFIGTAILCVIAVLSNVFTEKSSHEYVKVKKEYSVLLKSRKAIEKTLDKTYLSNDPLTHKYTGEFLQISKLTSLKYKEKLKIKNKDKFLHFNTLNVFLYQLSAFFILMCASILLFVLACKLKNDPNKKMYKAVSFLFLVFSFYYISWIVYDGNDLPYYRYILLIVVMSFIASYISVLILNSILNKKTLLQSHKNSIKSLVDFISIKAKNKYVSEEDKIEYTKDYLTEIKKTRNNE